MADSPLVIANHRAGAFHPMQIFNHRGGLFREGHIYRLPADLGVPPTNGTGNLTVTFSGFGSGSELTSTGTGSLTLTFQGSGTGTTKSAATTVVNISDMVTSGETLSTSVNCTDAMQHAIENVIRKVGPAAGITTNHVTIDFESVYWRVENKMAFPSDALMLAGIKHVCHHWPKGMTWRNGGIQAVSKDGHTSGTGGTAIPTIERDRYHIRIQQGVKRTSMSNNEQWLELNNFWLKGPLTYATNDNYQTQVLPREGQEAFYLAGAQWVRFVDCIIEQEYADVLFFQERDTTPITNRDGRVFPGMIEILGGTFRRNGIMNATLNTCRPPDAIYTPGWWKNTPENKTKTGVGYADQPSASGLQYGFWWHGNAAHPFQTIDHMRSWIDMEQQISYGYAGDIRIGADSNREHFKILWDQKPNDRDANTIQHFDFTQIRRFRMQHIYIDGAMNIGFLGSPSGILDANNQATRTLAGSSIGDPASSTTINVTVDPATSPSFPGAGRILVPTTVGHSHVRYTGRSATGFTGCTGGAGTMVAGTVRNATIKRDGCNLIAGSNNVVLGAVGSPVGGTGILHVDDHSMPAPLGMNPEPNVVRVWTTTGTAEINVGTKSGDTQFIGCTVASPASVGMVLQTGQAVTYAYNSPERIPYCTGDVELDDIYAINPSQSKTLNANDCDGFMVVNCRSPYRSTNVPFSNQQNVINFNKGGTSQFGSNNFFLV